MALRINDSNFGDSVSPYTEKACFAALTQYGLLRIAGDDADSFLQGQLTCDVAKLAPGHAQYGGYCTPQGRLLASFLLWRDRDVFFLQCAHELCPSLAKRLSMFVLRAKVKVSDASAEYLLAGVAGPQALARIPTIWADIPAMDFTFSSIGNARFLRLPGDRFLIMTLADDSAHHLSQLGAIASERDSAWWDTLETGAGIPWITTATQDQFTPQMLNLDLIGGLSFNKGCYPGQEIVARTHYLGRLKQRMFRFEYGGTALPAPGTKLFSPEFGDQSCGTVVNAARQPCGIDLLAVIQLASAASRQVRLASPEGEVLKLAEMPYKP